MGSLSASLAERQCSRLLIGTTGVRLPYDAPKIMLTTKQCGGCGVALYLNSKADEVEFINCTPHIVDIEVKKEGDTLELIGYRSNKSVNCTACSSRNLIKSFVEADGG